MQCYVLNRGSFPAFTEWVVLRNCFLNDLSVKNTSLFNYSVTIWGQKSCDYEIGADKVQERALRLTYKNNENNFQTLLNENNETSEHQRNLQFLMTEIYKIKNYAQPIMHHLFQFRESTLNLRNFRERPTYNKKTSNDCKGTQTHSHLVVDSLWNSNVTW